MGHLRPLVLLPPAALLAGCATLFPPPEPPGQTQAEPAGVEGFVDAQRRWQASGIDDYTWGLQFACECGLSGPWQVTVVDGKVAHAAKPDGAPVPRDLSGLPLTVGALLQASIAATKNGGSVAASWAGDSPVPTKVSMDPDPNAIDDELSVTVTGFQPAP